MQEVYKVVRIGEPQESSYYSCFCLSKWGLEYTLGEETKANIGYIFVFDTLEHAYKYIRSLMGRENFRVLRCVTTEIYLANITCNNMVFLSSEAWDIFWTLQAIGENPFTTFDSFAGRITSLPQGTVFVKNLTPQVVYPGEKRAIR